MISTPGEVVGITEVMLHGNYSRKKKPNNWPNPNLPLLALSRPSASGVCLLRANSGHYIHHDILIDESRFNGYFRKFMWPA